MKHIHVKLFPRYIASPLYMGYRITHVMDDESSKILSQCLPHPNISADYFKENLLKLYAFSDFHLSGDPPTKPMDIFGENWKITVKKFSLHGKKPLPPATRSSWRAIFPGPLIWKMLFPT